MKSDFIFSSAAALRRLLFWAHLACGVVAGVVILAMSVTGVLLAYQRQITAWADAMPALSAPAGATRLPIERLVAAGNEAAGGDVSTLVFRADASAPVTAMAGRKAPVFIDPYTAEVVGRGSARTRAFFHAVTDWHRWLATEGAARDGGRAVTGASNLAFLFIVVSGVYLWWPRNWGRRALAAVAVPSLRLAGKPRDFNWHNAVGFWSSVPLVVIVACGTVISYPWASDLVYRAFGEEPPKRAERSGGGGGREGRTPAAPARYDGMEALLARAETQMVGWNTLTLRLPIPAEGPVAFTLDRGEGARPDQRATLTLDRMTAAVVKWEPYETLTPGRQTRLWMRWAHTGEAAGVVGQTVAGLASAGAVVLVYTGLALAWRRFRAWRTSPTAAAPAAASLPLDPSTEPGGLS